MNQVFRTSCLGVALFTLTTTSFAEPANGGDADGRPRPGSPDSVGGGLRPLSAAALAGIGFGKSPNPYGFGFGGRIGYTLPSNIYLGGTFIYHVGQSDTATNASGTTKVSANTYYFGAEVGYNFVAGPVVLRPYGGIGVQYLKASVEGNLFTSPVNLSATESGLYLMPGLTVLYPIDNFFVGADARYNFYTKNSDGNGLGLLGTIGTSF